MIKYRAEQIIIDIPRENSDAWIDVVVQEVIKNLEGDVLNIIPRKEFVHKSASSIATTLYEYADPVLGGELKQISGAGIYLAISDIVLKSMLEKFGGTIVNGELIIEE